ncbi:MAG: AAA family ATPase [Myxococcota bacterium]|jgi:SpoVK/Ycf46/Vps4 family AAA+-type ATPase|nr:AAA family ATPase [Myxococcota bacterium]
MNSPLGEEISSLISSGWRLVAFESFEEDRALRILERVAQHHQRALIPWSLAAGLAPDGRGAGSLEAGLEALEQVEEPAVFVLLDVHLEANAALPVRHLRDLLARLARRKQCVVLLGPRVDLPLELSREAGRVSLPLPRADELHALFRKALTGVDAAEHAEFLEACVQAALGLTAAESLRVLRRSIALSNGLNASTVDRVIAAKREALQRTPALSFQDAEQDLDDVGGLGELKRWLRERQKAFGEEARNFNLPPPRGLLLLGVQGCGKSLSAKAVAREWHFPLLRLDLAAVFSGNQSSPEAAIREAVAVAESIAPAVLWIDEIEKGFATSEADPHGVRVLGSFLTWMAEKTAPVFVVATANDVASLPPELLRRGRFDELFFVDLPSAEERREILRIHIEARGRDPKQFDLEALAMASERLSGAELEQAVGAALYAAFAAERELEDNDLANAISESVPLYDTYEDRVKELRDWAQTRTRPASTDGKMAELFDSPRTTPQSLDK